MSNNELEKIEDIIKKIVSDEIEKSDREDVKKLAKEILEILDPIISDHVKKHIAFLGKVMIDSATSKSKELTNENFNEE